MLDEPTIEVPEALSLPPLPPGASPEPPPEMPDAELKYANGREAKDLDHIIFRDAGGAPRAGLVRVNRGSKSKMVIVKFLTPGGAGHDTVSIDTLMHVDDVLALHEAK